MLKQMRVSHANFICPLAAWKETDKMDWDGNMM